MKEKWIGLLDCNNFFVSCERLFRPELKNKPVIVLSSNDGCVVARSKEVKDMDVPMGVPYFKIKDIVKKEGVVTFSSHLSLYRDISRRVFSVMREELDLVEQYSIDEAFFEIDEDPEEVAIRVKKAVEKKVGIPVSIGISSSKTRTKYANILAKKGSGICVLNDKKWNKIKANIPLGSIWGIGGNSELNYKKYGLKKVADFVDLDKERIATIFGVNGLRLYKELEGLSVPKITHSLVDQKSLLSSRSFKDETSDLSVLADAVAYHVRHVAKDLRAMGMETTTIRVFARPNRYGDFLLRGGSKEACLTVPTNDSLTLLKTARVLLNDIYEPRVPYKKVGVTLSKLNAANHGQTNLFYSDNADNGPLMETIDKLNLKADKEILLIGSRLLSSKWQSKTDLRSPAYTTKWSEVLKVKAK